VEGYLDAIAAPTVLMLSLLTKIALDVETYGVRRLSEVLPVILDLGRGARKVPGVFDINVATLLAGDLEDDRSFR
jgi:hypothetical protein